MKVLKNTGCFAAYDVKRAPIQTFELSIRSLDCLDLCFCGMARLSHSYSVGSLNARAALNFELAGSARVYIHRFPKQPLDGLDASPGSVQG